jgi:hypothetical protein
MRSSWIADLIPQSLNPLIPQSKVCILQSTFSLLNKILPLPGVKPVIVPFL